MDDDFREDMDVLRKFRAQTDQVLFGLALGIAVGWWFADLDLTSGENAIAGLVTVFGLVLYREVRDARAEFLHHVILSQNGRKTRI